MTLLRALLALVLITLASDHLNLQKAASDLELTEVRSLLSQISEIEHVKIRVLDFKSA